MLRPQRFTRQPPAAGPDGHLERPLGGQRAGGLRLAEDPKSPVERLSEREFDVFIRLAQGATMQQIAEDLKISPSTVGTHLYDIKQKLDVVNQSELTLIAIRHGLILA
jgi:two-component system invasion response regulator UvrY